MLANYWSRGKEMLKTRKFWNDNAAIICEVYLHWLCFFRKETKKIMFQKVKKKIINTNKVVGKRFWPRKTKWPLMRSVAHSLNFIKSLKARVCHL